ncbi:PIG-L deacetylase family protein [Cylindrospermum sp. FACHB-282]|uniref:PIG-L deacetylase family protein n=1 Tax=Cylindrospermum sp. FACHB-282 TaxID=2692794 RepID=UPI001689C36B|nr:PIG-L deacetylase family protein [Cylindrospermum sp. FACHB-282]MBD2384425.1 PIG-L family deacetylase [Cylindrospermum sp. FACHB-282]
MNVKKKLKQLQKLIPKNSLYLLQYIHSSLVGRWILDWGSKPLAFSKKSAMVFSPHQDDETFGCGGMIALKREEGIPVIVAFLTDGGGAVSLDPISQNAIIQIRKQETVTALSILGVDSSEIHFLDQQDGKLRDLSLEQRQQTIVQIAELLRCYQPGEVYVPHRKDCHRDHEATYELVKEAITQAGIKVELLQYPIWLFWRSPIFILLKLQDIAAAYHLSIGSVQDKKNRAIASYASQNLSLPRGFIQRFMWKEEIFFKANN